MTTLDDVERTLTSDMLLITDAVGPVAIAGVMGGAETGSVLPHPALSCWRSATFDGINNRRTAQALRLHSEASHRLPAAFQTTLNPRAAARAAELMTELAGRQVHRPFGRCLSQGAGDTGHLPDGLRGQQTAGHGPEPD